MDSNFNMIRKFFIFFLPLGGFFPRDLAELMQKMDKKQTKMKPKITIRQRAVKRSYEESIKPLTRINILVFIRRKIFYRTVVLNLFMLQDSLVK